MAADHTGGQIDVRDVQGDQLAHADTGRVKQLEHCAVTVAFGVRTLRLREQELHFLAREDLRQLLLGLVRHELSGRVVLHIMIIEQETVEVFQRRDCPGNRGNRLAVAAHPIDVIAQLLFFRRAEVGIRMGVQVFTQLPYIPQV